MDKNGKKVIVPAPGFEPGTRGYPRRWVLAP